MKYNGWKLLDKIDVAIKTTPNYGGFTGYIVDHGDKKALERAKDWAGGGTWKKEQEPYEVHTFDNNGFSARIVASAYGSSQGGRVSFWACEIEKDGIKFTIGVNDAILADLIKNSDLSKGVVQQKVMFARQGGQPGLIHENMDAYNEAVADMEQKAGFKKAKKTKNWEIGGVYSTLTQTDICLGEVWDTMEEYLANEPGTSAYRWYARTQKKYRKVKEPKKTMAWVSLSGYRHKDGVPVDFEAFLKEELKDRDYVYFSTGVPPARSKASQLEVKETDMKLLDKLLSLKKEYGNYGDDAVKGRYVRELKWP